MNSLQLLNRLVRKSTINSISEARADQLEDFTDAINAAVWEFYLNAPERLRRTTASITLPAPRTIEITTTAGSPIVSGTPFTADDRGRVVRIAGDTRYNEVTDENALLHDAATTGTVSATIYSNGIRFEDTHFERVITSPRVVETGKKLINDSGAKSHYYDWRSGHYNFRDASFDGDPTWYWVEHVGVAASSDDVFHIRMFPLPVRAMTVVFDAEVFPAKINMTQLREGVALPIPLPYVQVLLLPLAIYHLMSTETGDQKHLQAAERERERVLQSISRIAVEAVPPNRRLIRTR